MHGPAAQERTPDPLASVDEMLTDSYGRRNPGPPKYRQVVCRRPRGRGRIPLRREESVMLFRRGAMTEDPARAWATGRALGYTEQQWRMLCALRAHYRQWGDAYGRREINRLQFAQWLVVKGRLRR
jgi:hypothetical protein